MAAHNEHEIEAKFLVRDLGRVERRLKKQGARRTVARVYERNLRFDTPTGELTASKRVLRLRQDNRAVLTFKGPPDPTAEVNARCEIEVSLSDIDAAQRIFEALGYVVSVMYEKYRTTYSLHELEIVLDEMPYGNFVEIEGPDQESIRQLAGLLELDWEARITDSYLGLFDKLKANRNLSARHLCFEELSGAGVQPEDLGVRLADR